MTRPSIPLCVLCLVATGCAAEPRASQPARSARARPLDVDSQKTPITEPIRKLGVHGDTCPAETADTWVSAQEVHRGAALVFTRSHAIPSLRGRVADMAIPSALENSEPHFDNIRLGVRVVFQTNDQRHVGVLRRIVSEHARLIARTCGLALALRSEPKPEPPPATAAQKQSGASSRTDSKAAASGAFASPAAAAKGKEGASKDKATDKKPAVKPTDKSKPKADEKPKLPPLPGVRPDPIGHHARSIAGVRWKGFEG